jgi:hypothetical protein
MFGKLESDEGLALVLRTLCEEGAIIDIDEIIRISEYPARADTAVSKINTDYKTCPLRCNGFFDNPV